MTTPKWTTEKGFFGALFARPLISSVTHVNAPVALRGGTTALRIVAVGFGFLYIGKSVRLVRWGCDEVFFTPVAETVSIRFVGLGGVARYMQVLAPRKPAPVRVEVRGHERPNPPAFTRPVRVSPPLVEGRAPRCPPLAPSVPGAALPSPPSSPRSPSARTVPRIAPFPPVDELRRRA